MQNTAVLDALAHLAWADNILFEDERDLLTTTLREENVPEADWKRWLEAAPPLPTAGELAAALPDDEARRRFLRKMVRLAKIDAHLDPQEWRVLQVFCQTLGVPATTWDELVAWLG